VPAPPGDTGGEGAASGAGTSGPAAGRDTGRPGRSAAADDVDRLRLDPTR
jgi:hypothetical protein